jgi:ABC-2 type transport system permease protein
MTALSSSAPLSSSTQRSSPVPSSSPVAQMPIGRLLRAYASEVRYESMRVLRTPGFAVPFLALPVPIYLFFGVVLAGGEIAKNPAIGNYLFSSWMVFATMMPALFGVSCALALERDAGLLKLKRAWPAPAGAHLAAKIATAMILAALAIASLIVASLVVGKTTLSGGQIASMTVVMLLGAIPLAALGLCIGAYVSGSAAPAVVNVIFLPMLWLSGLFFPLPKFLEPWVVIWPAFHLNQVSMGAAGLSRFQFVPPQLSVAVLVGMTVLFGGLAIRRLARKG